MLLHTLALTYTPDPIPSHQTTTAFSRENWMCKTWKKWFHIPSLHGSCVKCSSRELWNIVFTPVCLLVSRKQCSLLLWYIFPRNFVFCFLSLFFSRYERNFTKVEWIQMQSPDFYTFYKQNTTITKMWKNWATAFEMVTSLNSFYFT